MRKLATIREIKDLLPIIGADRIEVAVVDGWQVIVKKGEFSIHSLCVFFEIDSFLPVDDRYAFLGKTQEHQGNLGYRIKTMKMKKTLSQGLALPLYLFPELALSSLGDDVTDTLKVLKYDNTSRESNSTSVGKKQKRAPRFPKFLPKTDQERIQNLMAYFTLMQNMYFEETLKLDGSSITLFNTSVKYTFLERLLNVFKGNFNKTYSKFGVASRNLELAESKPQVSYFNNGGKVSEFRTSDFWKVAYKYDIKDKLPIGYAIQGELIGPKIQNNHEKVSELELHIFDVFNITTQQYLTPKDRVEFLTEHKLINLHIPIVSSRIQIFKECGSIEELLKRAEGPSIHASVVSEGRVYKSVDNTHISFKVISNAFLTKFEQ